SMAMRTLTQGRGQFVSSVRGREARKRRRWRLRAMPGVLVCVAIFSSPAAADRLRDGIRAFAAHDYVTAARIFTDLAPLGDARAQTYLGYMFANGKGVPQNHMVAAGWYRCASQQGFPAAQYLLGLMYDKGQGVPQDYVIAYALLDLAVAGAGREREHWVRIRDAVASKLSLIERNRAQQLAFEAPPAGTCLPIVTGY
ncbi:MAG: tetratricopeptide repeat protein, partial [Methylocella sp.]